MAKERTSQSVDPKEVYTYNVVVEALPDVQSIIMFG